MSHQVVITFDIDENKVIENAEKEAGRQIAQAVLKEVFGDTYIGSYTARRNASDFLAAEIMQLLRENKDEIVDRAVKEVCDSLRRSKAVKEKLQEALNDGKN